METYLTLLYVTLEQELALKEYFLSKGWTYSKLDLNVMTDRVGPFNNPQAVRTKSGKIIMYNEVSVNDANDRPTKARSKIMTEKRKGRKSAVPAAVSDTIKVEVSSERREFPGQLDGYEGDEAEESLENDDGDNDDDYADDLNNKIREGEENISGDNLSPKRHGRPVRQSQKLKGSNLGSPADTDPAEQEMAPTGRKRRIVAAKAVETIQTVMSEEKEKTDVKPTLNVNTRPRRVPEKKPPPGVKRKCSLCPKEFIYQYTLNNHFKLCHDPHNPPKPKPRKKHLAQQCDICGKVFSRSDTLLDHKKQIHMGLTKKRTVQISTCDQCGASYKRATHLKEHILVKHSDSQLPHPCKFCDKSFIRSRFLHNHMNRDHLRIKPYKCDFCSKTFFSQFSAEKHMKSKICQSDRIKRFKCLQCDLRYQTASNLEMHMTAKHFGGAYSCVCGEVVQWSGSVAKHKRHCKAYQAYVESTGDVVDKVCNIIEVKFEDVLIGNDDGHGTVSSNDSSKDKSET